MITAKKIGFPILATTFGLALGLLFAEIVSSFFLPAPQTHRLPLVRMQADPDTGYLHRPNQDAFSNGGQVRINQWGFRGHDWTLKKAKNTERVMLLGDSYTFGQGVDDDQTFGVVLEKRLNQNLNGNQRYEVLNFGASGYDTGHEIAVLKKYALQFKPDVVVLNFFLNDLYYIHDYEFYPEMFRKEAAKFSPLKWYLREMMRKSRIVMTLWDYQQAKKISKTADMMESYIQGGQMAPDGVASESWKVIEERLKEFRKLADTNGFVPLLNVIPTPQEIVDNNITGTYEPFLRRIADENQIRVISLLTEMRSSELSTELIIPYDAHFNVEGNEFVAEVLFQEIGKLKQIS